MYPGLIRVGTSFETFENLRLEVEGLQRPCKRRLLIRGTRCPVLREGPVLPDHTGHAFSRCVESFGNMDRVPRDVVKRGEIGLVRIRLRSSLWRVGYFPYFLAINTTYFLHVSHNVAYSPD
jgi:hypothetical protein